jgi:hypothetical protein
VTTEDAYAAALAALCRKERHFPGLPPSPGKKPPGRPAGFKRPAEAELPRAVHVMRRSPDRDWSSDEIAAAVNTGRPAALEQLRKLAEMGLAVRLPTLPNEPHRYRLTQQGAKDA